MVLESLMNPKKAEGHPFEVFFLGFAYASIAFFLSLWVFSDEASIVMVLLTVIASLPLMYHTLKREEAKDLAIKSEITLLKEHGKALMFLIFLFLGFVVAFSLWYIIIPSDVAESAFSTQRETIQAINSNVVAVSSSNVIDTTTSASLSSTALLQILSNNVKVLLFCILFAFFYGAGAIFILSWNATVISAAVGTFIRNNLSSYANALGLAKVAGYFHVFSLGLLRYLLHGVPEILAYFIGGLAGGIISVAMIRHDFGSRKFQHVLLDSFDLLVIAVFVLFIAALIEVYITPAIF